MKQLSFDIKSNVFKPFYLFNGNETYLLNQFKEKFIDAFRNDSFNIKIIDEDFVSKSNIEDIYSIISTMPLLAEKKLIIFLKTSFLKNKGDSKLKDVLFSSKDINVCIFIEEDISTSNCIYKMINEFGYIANLNTPSQNDLFRWLKTSIFNKNHINISDEDIQYLITKIGNSMNTLKNEADKLCSYVADKNIVTKKDIDDICINNYDSVAYDITNFLNKKKTKEAFEVYKKFILNNPSDEKNSNMLLFSLLKNNYSQILICKELLENGQNRNAIAKSLGVSDGQAYYIIENSKLLNYDYLYKKYKNIIELEKKFKSGDISVENAVLEILCQ